MRVIPTEIPEVKIIKLRIFEDERGFFMETYQREKYSMKAGINLSFVQDNHSGSKQGVLRGLHYQINQTQGKLVSVISGSVFDAAVDIRRGSPTFGKWVGTVLDSKEKAQLWIPPGFAHGFYVLSDWADVLYKVTDFYAPEFERTILWNDEQIGIQWPLVEGKLPKLSKKDSEGKALNEAEIFEWQNLEFYEPAQTTRILRGGKES